MILVLLHLEPLFGIKGLPGTSSVQEPLFLQCNRNGASNPSKSVMLCDCGGYLESIR